MKEFNKSVSSILSKKNKWPEPDNPHPKNPSAHPVPEGKKLG
jgi:hypothetical protein